MNSRRWSAEETEALRELREAGETVAECADALGRTTMAIEQRLNKLGLSSADSRHRFTADEDETIRINYPMWPAFLIGHLIGHSATSVSQRAARLGVKKSPEFHSNPHAHLWDARNHPNTVAARFRPGSVPANKGMRRPGWAPGRMAQTQFKKGRPAHEARNYVPIGTEKVDPKRNALMRKITDDPNVPPVYRWKPVHVLVWEAANGPVPEGHICVFKKGTKTFIADQITADKLEVVTLAENMRRNTIHNYPPQLKRAMQVRGALNRRINKLAKTRKTP